MTDVDWAGDRSGWASISSFVWSYGGGLISWSVKKQNCMALSSTEAEYVALTEVFTLPHRFHVDSSGVHVEL
jgi:hypothetical protein